MAEHKITIIGAGNVGTTCAIKIAQKKLADIVLIDIIEGLAQTKSLDIRESIINQHDIYISGTNSYKSSVDSDIIIITAGITRKPGMNRDELIKNNANIINTIVKLAVKRSPEAILIIVTNPVDIMAYLAYKISKFSTQRIIGMGGLLDSIRFRFFIAEALKVSIENVDGLVIGEHGDTMVPLPRFSRVAGIPITELLPIKKINQICERTSKGGVEIINFLKNNSAYYAPASSIVEMVESILKNKHKILPCAVYLAGEYGYHDLFLGVPVKLGKGGVHEIIKLNLLPKEKNAMDKSAKFVYTIINQLSNLGF